MAQSYVPFAAHASEKSAMDRGGIAGVDPVEQVARVAAARRSRLLRIYRRRLRFEDLEDCYSQATFELLARAQRSPFTNGEHVANALELRFKSRIEDRRRAIEGRSSIEAALARAVPVDAPGHGLAELEDRAASVERQVFARTEMRRLRELITDLTRDQQLVLASQVLVEMELGEFCRRYGWSIEKYRKVAQRARGRLRTLADEYERGERCRRLEPDVLALRAGVAEGEARSRARAHVANCQRCARLAGAAARGSAALAPVPAAAGAGGLAATLGGTWSALRRLLGFARHPLAEAGSSGGAGVAGGSLAGAGALKVGIAAVCVAGAAGGYAACARLGVLPALGLDQPTHHAARLGAAVAPPARHRHGAASSRHAPARVSNAPVRTAPAPRVSTGTSTTTTTTMPSTTTPARVTRTIAATRPTRGARLSPVQQVRREFGRVASARVASTRAGGRAGAGAAAAGRAIAQIRREFGTPAAVTAAATTPPAAPAAASASPTPAAVAPAGSGAAPPPSQSPSQATQTRSEFGFEK